MSDTPTTKNNERNVPWTEDTSPKGKYRSSLREMSESLDIEPTAEASPKGRPPQQRPFEVTLVRPPPDARFCPLHSHTFQWEYYIITSGHGQLLQSGAPIPREPGDHILQPPGWAHTMENSGDEDLVYYVIADNPNGEIAYYPDSDKWTTWPPGHLFRMTPLPLSEEGYFDGEE